MIEVLASFTLVEAAFVAGLIVSAFSIIFLVGEVVQRTRARDELQQEVIKLYVKLGDLHTEINELDKVVSVSNPENLRADKSPIRTAATVIKAQRKLMGFLTAEHDKMKRKLEGTKC